MCYSVKYFCQVENENVLIVPEHQRHVCPRCQSLLSGCELNQHVLKKILLNNLNTVPSFPL